MYVRQRLPLYVVVVACVLQRVVSLMKQFELNIARLSRLPYLAPTQRFFPHASPMFVHPPLSKYSLREVLGPTTSEADIHLQYL